MSVSEESIHQIKVKVQDLIHKSGKIQSERDDLHSEVDRLKDMLEKMQVVVTGKESEVASLSRRLQEIKETETKKVEADQSAMKNRISELVQEIDKCIMMLNK